MSITDCSLVGGADRSHPLPCPPVASVRSMEQRYPTVDDDDNAEGNASKRKQEDDLDDATMESTENDDADASEANTSASSNRCTVLRYESINKKTRTSCIVSTTELIATTSVGSTAMEVADVCPPERHVRINNVVHRRIVLEGTHCPPICPGHEVLYASTKRAIDVDIGFVSAMYSISKGCHSHNETAAFVCSDTHKSATMYLIRRGFVSPFLFLKDSWHQLTITINGKEHFLHSAEGESDFLFALMRPVKALRLVREQKVLSPRGALLPFFTLLISTGERNAFGEEALSAAALDPFDGKDFHYGRDLFCKGTVRTCYHMCMDKCGTYNMNSLSTEQWALKTHRYSGRHESWLDDSWQQFRRQLAAEQLVHCSSMRSRLVDYGSGGSNENIFNEMEVMAYIDGRIAVQPTRTGADHSTSWVDQSKDPWPHFVPLRATGICFDNIYLATKLYPLGSVHDYMRRHKWSRLEESAVRVIVRHVLLSLRLLHSHGICHRDISPHNIVLEQIQQQQQSMDGSFPHNMRFVLMDMGHTAFHSFDRREPHSSSSSSSSSSSHHCKGAFGMLKRPTSRMPPGKVHYHCPELPRAETYCGFAVDVWQVGVLIFALLFGHGPFNAEVPAQLLMRKNTWFRTVEDKKLLKAKLVYCKDCLVSIEESGLLSDDCMSFLDRALQSDPAQRMKVDEALRHRWML